MSQAITAAPSGTYNSTVEAATPVVFIDGIPEPGLSVARLTLSLDNAERNAELAWLAPDRAVPDRLDGRRVTIALPHPLSDGETRWQCLLDGRAAVRDDGRAARHDRAVITVPDALTDILAEPADSIGVWPGTGLSVADVVTAIASMLQAEYVFACDTDATATSIQPTNPRTQSIAAVLLPTLDRLGLMLGQSLSLTQGRATRSLTLMPLALGRRIALPWPDSAGRGGAVLSVDVQGEQRAPRAWIAQGDRPMVEDTFALFAGWDPALQGEADSEYGRLTSTDFSRFGSVYRAWVLNEDGVYNDAPFNLSTFDAGGLFDTPNAIAQPLRLAACLAADASGRAITPVIESSTDSGSSWSAYPGQAQTMSDRAGVLLTDDTLPASILAAAKAGTLLIRVTASLTGPDPIQARRWDGNPFAGAAPTRIVRFGDRYRWRRVASTSIHSASIAAGTLTADLADDRPALRTALRQQVERSGAAEQRATLRLAGAWTAIQPGDRVDAVIGRDSRIDASPARFAGPTARVRSSTIDFGVASTTPRTTVRLESP